MTPLVVSLLLAAALAHATWNALLKGRRGEPLAASAGLAATWAVLGAPLLLFFEPPAPEAYPYLAASIVVHLVYFSLLVAAYRVADLSVVYPIARGVPPLLVAGIGWAAAAERVPALGIGGVALVVGGVLTLGFARAPEKADAPDAESRRRRGVLLALATAGFIAGYTVIDGLGARAARAPFGYWLWLTVIQGALFAAGAMLVGGAEVRRAVWRRRGAGVIAGVLSAGGYAVALWAMTLAPLAFVSALRETSVVFAAAIGAYTLKEPFGRRRIVAALLVAAGVVAIQLSG